jgi:hypothetical protein
VRALALALVLGALFAGRAGAVGDEVPDAQLLLDLDLLSQSEPPERDLLGRLSVIERLRLLELFRLLEARPAVPARQREPADPGRR